MEEKQRWAVGPAGTFTDAWSAPNRPGDRGKLVSDKSTDTIAKWMAEDTGLKGVLMTTIIICYLFNRLNKERASPPVMSFCPDKVKHN